MSFPITTECLPFPFFFLEFFITNAIAQENVSLEHLIEKTFPEFINAGYDYAIKPTEENKKKHNALAEQLRAEEQQAISKGILAYPLRYPNQVVSPELEKKGYNGIK